MNTKRFRKGSILKIQKGSKLKIQKGFTLKIPKGSTLTIQTYFTQKCLLIHFIPLVFCISPENMRKSEVSRVIERDQWHKMC